MGTLQLKFIIFQVIQKKSIVKAIHFCFSRLIRVFSLL